MIFRNSILPVGFVFACSTAYSQPPQRQPSSPSAFVDRMMAFDKNQDGKLTRDEITDERLADLFDRADSNHDGVVTKEELQSLYSKEAVQGGPGRGPGGPGGRGGDRGPGGRGGFGPQPGQIMPAFLQERLNLTSDQKNRIEALQKEVDAKLDAILTSDQKRQLKQGGGPPPPN